VQTLRYAAPDAIDPKCHRRFGIGPGIHHLPRHSTISDFRSRRGGPAPGSCPKESVGDSALIGSTGLIGLVGLTSCIVWMRWVRAGFNTHPELLFTDQRSRFNCVLWIV
jgi:hypothetical protein